MIKVVEMPALDDLRQQNRVLDSILPLGTEITEESQFKFDNVDIYKDDEKFVYFLKELLHLAYNRTDLSFKGILIFIKKMGQRYPVLQLNQIWCATYSRAEAL